MPPSGITDIAARHFDHSHQAAIATDVRGYVTYWNDAARQLYGWTRDEVLGRPISELTVGPEHERVARDIMDIVLQTGFWAGEFDVRHEDGTQFRAFVRDYLVKDPDGQPTGLLGVSTDTTQEALLVQPQEAI